jgi:hypothetical protein
MALRGGHVLCVRTIVYCYYSTMRVSHAYRNWQALAAYDIGRT